ncbi:SipW-dependent-type signal peptide-containing protein [Enteractinococcus helveticum]|uniref:SipW-cognate class signal peptide n=1 Tax=Enteractinococcus helveticum TaxID=1837282 RepID=A0A1B7LVD3_9MICC|nr:SipW-dependent-type signal peptide-containing protein [Enteractinococcus helveticum]OAV52152.1 hypothetical protein A6F49_01135 [Enteractinococcus helveticum]
MSQTVTEPKKQTSRKVRALLAGGLVLGVGAAVTLATWTDQEWATGIFGAGSFNIQSSNDGATFADNESQDGAAALDFELTGGDNLNLAPGATVAAPFVLQLDADTTYDANVSLEEATATPVDADLTYGIVTVDDVAACTAEATGTAVVPAGTAIGTTEGATVFDLTAGAEGATGAPVTLCFQVTAGDGLVEGQEITASWGFLGESVE